MPEAGPSAAWLAAPIVAPLFAAIGVALAGTRVRAALCSLGALGTAAISMFVLARVVSEGPLRHQLGGWGAPWASICSPTASRR